MNNDKIIEGNKLIAEFMYPLNTFSTFYIPEHTFIEIKYGEYDSHEVFSIDELKYHSSWDWLMPVVEKIRKTNVNIGYGISFHIMNDECWFGIDNLRHEGFNNHLSDSLIASIWLACIEFINWYNQQNK